MSDNAIVLTRVRLSFPHVAAPQVRDNPDGTKKSSYSADFILAPDHPGWAQFMTVVQQMAQAKWGANAAGVLAMVNQDKRLRGFGRGEEKMNKEGKVYDGYAGNLYIGAGSSTQPQIGDARGAIIDPANTMALLTEARKLYGGCWVNAVVKPWMQENKHGRAVRCDFVAIQFLEDGEAFGDGRVSAAGLFGATPAAAAAPAAAPAEAAWGVPAMPGLPFPGAGLPGAPAASNLPSFLS